METSNTTNDKPQAERAGGPDDTRGPNPITPTTDQERKGDNPPHQEPRWRDNSSLS